MGSAMRCACAALAVATVLSAGCMRSIPPDLSGMEKGLFVLRWEGLREQPDNKGSEWTCFCYVIEGDAGCKAVMEWIAANWDALNHPSELRPMRVTPVKELHWFNKADASLAGLLTQNQRPPADVSVQEPDLYSPRRWDLWLRIPGGPLDWSFSKMELLDRPWEDNLPFTEFERLKGIFKAHGRPLDPAQPDLCRVIGKIKRPKRILEGGTYVLAERDSDHLNKVSCYKIEGGEGRKAVEAWIAANYEALKIAGVPRGALISLDVIYWFDDNAFVRMDVLTHVPLYNRWWGPERNEWLEIIPCHEYERLKSIFKKYGQVTDFRPETLEATREPASIAD